MQQPLADKQLIDSYQRRFEYLRLSITEQCNFRCQYCLPDGYHANHTQRFLTLSEIEHLANAFSEMGVKKVRLTGGEPTLRRDFTDIIALLASYPSLTEIALTTNGARLYRNIAQWRAAGLTALNVSIDSFVPEQFALITGQDKLRQVMRGIDQALAIGMTKVKLNSVLMKGVNDDLQQCLPWLKRYNVELRFIELMETGDGTAYFNRYHLSGAKIEQQLLEQGWQLQAKAGLSGPAQVYQHADYQGRIGLIMPYAKGFCQSCNRLRISAIGQLHYCLFGESAINLRDLLHDADQKQRLQTRILDALRIKPPSHQLQLHRSGTTQNLSFIGG